jgi:hypothetical protein
LPLAETLGNLSPSETCGEVGKAGDFRVRMARIPHTIIASQKTNNPKNIICKIPAEGIRP